MKVTATDFYQKTHTLTDVISLFIDKNLSVPADTAAITALDEGFPELCTLTVTHGGKTLFHGQIDQQTQSIGETRQITLKARNLAAPLLDNESPPGIYHGLWFSDLFTKHLAPFGIKGFDFGNRRFGGEFEIIKGESLWQTAARFLALTHGSAAALRVDERGFLTLANAVSDAQIIFGTGAGEQKYLSLSSVIKRYKPLSEVVTVDEATQSYRRSYYNYSAISRGIERRRFMRYFELSEADKQYKCEELLRKSEEGSRYFQLKTLSVSDFNLGAAAKIAGHSGRFYIAGTAVSADKSGIFTTVTLWPK